MRCYVIVSHFLPFHSLEVHHYPFLPVIADEIDRTHVALACQSDQSRTLACTGRTEKPRESC